MLFYINYQVDFLDIISLIISFFALTATLRKKEYGKFYLIPKTESQQYIWIKLLKSDIYDIKFSCEPYSGMKGRIDLLYPGNTENSVWQFIEEIKPTFEIGSLKADTIVKFHNCKSTRIHVSFQDKYNNKYTQEIKQDSIGQRRHKNIWNLTFIGT